MGLAPLIPALCHGNGSRAQLKTALARALVDGRRACTVTEMQRRPTQPCQWRTTSKGQRCSTPRRTASRVQVGSPSTTPGCSGSARSPQAEEVAQPC
eukprot:16331069-Heterocapsa_arctica.AAC.1